MPPPGKSCRPRTSSRCSPSARDVVTGASNHLIWRDLGRRAWADIPLARTLHDRCPNEIRAAGDVMRQADPALSLFKSPSVARDKGGGSARPAPSTGKDDGAREPFALPGTPRNAGADRPQTARPAPRPDGARDRQNAAVRERDAASERSDKPAASGASGNGADEAAATPADTDKPEKAAAPAAPAAEALTAIDATIAPAPAPLQPPPPPPAEPPGQSPDAAASVAAAPAIVSEDAAPPQAIEAPAGVGAAGPAAAHAPVQAGLAAQGTLDRSADAKATQPLTDGDLPAAAKATDAAPPGEGQVRPSGQVAAEGSAGTEVTKTARGEGGAADETARPATSTLATVTAPAAPLPPQAGAAAIPPADVAQAAAAAKASAQATHPVVKDVPLAAVPIEIGMRALAGSKRFDIRLDPPELGRIDVRLEFDDAGSVKVQLTVDRVETLALLQRDARTLERAFEQAGLKPTDGGVDLTLRDQQAHGGHQRRDEGSREAMPGAPPRSSAAEISEDIIPARALWRGSTGLDLRI
ncbi:flagellar hook-length control protein FliK [Chelatococcus sp. SYSU_G07232]|uniref:Flagellar hook-length control protein FliK n=1 Tax=Chelatococcus albus TaxID=3047466 RepID=A0ABT7AFF8_9HYPH|nr:flagellar hook-length control protein FliK [Chelatococcus sp. SYSU_G07232]MDJ1158117.1 flagellar hook-length control protein FliK [Chelatococcus sp. SYSU_G07232]